MFKNMVFSVFVFMLTIVPVLSATQDAGFREGMDTNEGLEGWFYDADINWSEGGIEDPAWRTAGHWGLVYTKERIDGYFNIDARNRPQYKEIRGAYLRGSQPINTRFGRYLDVNYSPYVLKLHEDVLGLRIYNMRMDFKKIGQLALDGVYLIGYTPHDWLFRWDLVYSWAPDYHRPWEDYSGDHALNVKGKLLGTGINATILRYKKVRTDEKFFANYAVELNKDFFQRIELGGVYGSYEERKDWFYEAKLGLNLIPQVFRVYGVWRDSQFVIDRDNLDNPDNWKPIRGPVHNASDKTYRYIFYERDPMVTDIREGRDQLADIALLGKSYNIGFTNWFNLFNSQNILNVEYASKAAPYNPGPLDPMVNLSLTSQTAKMEIVHTLSYFLAEEQNAEKRYLYELGVTGPVFKLPFNLTAQFRYDFDYNYNFDPNHNNFEGATNSLLGLRVYTRQNIWRLNRLRLDGFFLYDISDVSQLQDSFKYGLMARYNAPNLVKIRVQYFSSTDLANAPKNIYGLDRYRFYRWFKNDQNVNGLRLIIALPF